MCTVASDFLDGICLEEQVKILVFSQPEEVLVGEVGGHGKTMALRGERAIGDHAVQMRVDMDQTASAALDGTFVHGWRRMATDRPSSGRDLRRVLRLTGITDGATTDRDFEP
jgi:hypothetical protein